jgi:alanyl-tRNA synthetase
MRRAILQGRVIGLEAPYLERFAETAIELFADVAPQLQSESGTVMRWVADEERNFGRTLNRGSELLGGLIERAKREGTSWVSAEDAFQLHDTYGFPYEMTRELLADEGLSVDDQGFESLMEQQRERARRGTGAPPPDTHEEVIEFARAAPETRFVGYERLAAETSVAAAQPLGEDGALLVKLEESPFYPEGGGQVSDSGVITWDGGEAPVEDVYRVGGDQVLRIARSGAPVAPGARVEARVEHETRHATMRNHTATHLLHAALRQRLGTHVRQAGSAVRPDKLRFDFTHGQPLTPAEQREIEDAVNDWIKASHHVRAMEMARQEAEALGAMALFGEKYGEWVRMVEVDEVSRELCGGTHVATTAECGIFAIVSEGSSAANVRRIEALTGPAAIDWFRERSLALDRAGKVLGSADDPVAAAERAAERLAEFERKVAEAGRAAAGEEAEQLLVSAEDVGGVKVVAARSAVADQRALMDLGAKVRDKLGDAAVVLGSATDGKVSLVALMSKAVTARGLSAQAVVREAAEVVGGGGGGRDDAAQAGGRDPEKLDAALETAKAAIVAGLGA